MSSTTIIRRSGFLVPSALLLSAQARKAPAASQPRQPVPAHRRRKVHRIAAKRTTAPTAPNWNVKVMIGLSMNGRPRRSRASERMRSGSAPSRMSDQPTMPKRS